jgi:uncharacterized phage protein gp47/JayE
MTTYPLPTLSATIDENGISAPSYPDILNSLIAQVQAIYGSDIVLDPSSQDYQFLVIFALAIYDNAQTQIAVYNQFSPATAIGRGLSSVVKINGIARAIATNSSADVLITGQAGLEINNGQIGDEAGFTWLLPYRVTIDPTGQVSSTATCVTPGNITAAAGAINRILTPVPGVDGAAGWQRVWNPLPAVPGAPVETDAALRRRQSISAAIPSLTVIDGINAALAALPGVDRLKIYENDTAATDLDRIPSHSIAVVIEGGDDAAIAGIIALKKTPGTGTYGSVSETVLDAQGVPNLINFFPLSLVTISVEITLTALQGYSSTIGNTIIQQVSDFNSTLPIGYDVYLSKEYASTELAENAGGLTYDVTNIRLSRSGNFAFDTPAVGFDEGYWFVGLISRDMFILFSEAAVTLTTDITLIVNPS